MSGLQECFLSTPVGWLRLAADEDGVREIAFSRRDARLDVADGRGRRPVAEPLGQLIRQLDEYFAGERERFDLTLAPVGTPFQLAVWSMLRTIPYGATVTYGKLARRLGRPDASRAVGAANGRNPIPIVIPCHRVIGADGSLTGFGGGLPIKRRLLSLEAGQLEAFLSPEGSWKPTAAESPSPR